MQAGQALIIVGAVDADVALDVLAEFLADFGEHGFIARFTHDAIGEVGVHAGTVPVELFAQWLRFPVDGEAVALRGTLEQLAGDPGFVPGTLGAFGEHLKFPLPGGHFSVDSLYVDACLQTQVEMILDDIATVSVGCAY